MCIDQLDESERLVEEQGMFGAYEVLFTPQEQGTIVGRVRSNSISALLNFIIVVLKKWLIVSSSI